MLDKETFRRLDMYRIRHGTGGRFDRVYTDKTLAERREESIGEATQRSHRHEVIIAQTLQKVFDNQTARSPLLSGRDYTTGKEGTS